MSNFKYKLNYEAYDNLSRLAVIDDRHNIKYTYKELIEFSQGFNQYRLKNKKIGILIDKSADYIAGLYSVILSNNSFVPLDPELPIDRLNFIINDANLDYILTNDRFIDHLIFKKITVPVLSLVKYTVPFKFKFNKKDLMYTIYTSGTTGVPKGVEVSYEGIYNVISQQIALFNIDQSNIYLFLSISFDASLSDIFCSLLSGSTLYINESIKTDISKFIDYMNTHGIDYVDIPPSFLKLIEPELLNTLKTIVIGGEVADKETVKKYSKLFKLINVYGPTEATICTSYSICDQDWDIPLIGTPLHHVEYLILNDFFEPTQVDEEGELYIGGIQLAIGYTNDRITQEKFLYINQKRFYKSGDKVVRRSKGIEFIGRIDRQIKHNGQLICLEEIEQAINSIKEIKNVSVVYKNKKIIAYYEGSVNNIVIKNHISKILPHYMTPHFFFNKQIPKTASGKNDSKSLSLTSSLFEELLCVFSDILESEIIDHDLSFSDLGADSLNFIQLQMELNKRKIMIDYNYLMNHNRIIDIINYKTSKIITKQEMVNKIEISTIDNIDKELTFSTNNSALVTGSNGFLGIHLLKELTSVYDIIYCLVRADDLEEATVKMKKSEKFYNVTLEYKKLTIIPISQLYNDYLGMPITVYKQLETDIAHIYHLAGNVNNLLSFEQLYQDNVQASLNLLAFSRSETLKYLHNASTLSVYVSGEHEDNLIINHEPLEIDNNILYTGYAQTKWLSEYTLLMNNHYNNVIHYRFGLLVPTLKQNTMPNSFLSTLLKDMLMIDNMPKDNKGLSFDFTPVDIAAKTMIKASLERQYSIYNISLNHKVYLNDLYELINTSSIEPTVWFESYSEHTLSQLLTLLDGFNYKNMNLFEMTNVQYIENSRIDKYNTTPIKVIEYLEKYLKNIRNHI